MIDVSLETPLNIRRFQRKLYTKAKQEPSYRFDCLYDKICREDILAHAYEMAKANGGAPGMDRESFDSIESGGRRGWLAAVRKELIGQTYRPEPVRRVMIPKPGGGERPLGIPTIRDRVVQTATKLVIEPIFEADLEPNAYGYRPKRSARDAVQKVHQLLRVGYTDVVDADLSKYFDTIPHAEILNSVARRIVDRRMLRLIKMWLTAPVMQRDEERKLAEHRPKSQRDSARRCHQPFTGEPVHEPVSEVLATARKGRRMAGGDCRLCGRFRDPEPRERGGGAHVDAESDGPNRTDPERAEDEHP